MKSAYGLTLLELLCCLAILAILWTVALPSFQYLLVSTRSTTIYNELFTLLQYTRSKAVFTSSSVIFCPSDDTQTCVNDWSKPWIIFVDSNDNHKRDDDEPLDRYMTILKEGEKVYWRSFGRKPYIRYIADGSTEYQSGNLTICPKEPALEHIQKIIIYRSGRPRRALEKEIKIINCL